jgi:hypothetical protein
MAMDSSTAPLRLLRPVGEPLGLYLRPGRNDHVVLGQALVAGHGDFSGFVFDPCLESRHSELRAAAIDRKLEAVLDPRSVELATEGGITRSGVADLPWSLGGSGPHTPRQLEQEGDRLAEELANHVVNKSYTAVLAPSHYRASARDEWADVDSSLTIALREALDKAGASEVPIYYSLITNGPALASWDERRRFKDRLGALPIDAMWLRVHRFGTTSSGPLALRRYIDAGRDLQSLNLPLVAERVGTAGLPLMAFGAVGGIEGGITLGERFNFQDLKKKPKDGDGSGFSPQARVYIAELGTFLSAKQAAEFFEIRGMKAKFACRDTECCRRGVADMTKDPRPHFLRKRPREVAEMSRLPQELRAPTYLDEFLRPATDLALSAAQAYPALEKTRLRLEHWRTTLGALHRDRPAESFAISPRGQRLRKSA